MENKPEKPPFTAPEQLAKAGNQIEFSRGLGDWLHTNGVAVAFTSYESGELFMLGRGERGHISLHFTKWQRPMGLTWAGGVLSLGTQNHIHRLVPCAPSGPYDTVFMPSQSVLTGDTDAHEIVIDSIGRTFFANTRYSCVAETSLTKSFRPHWKPDFISALVPEDRCHLNGIGLRDGELRYASMCSRSDSINGWKANRWRGGAIYDVKTDQILQDNLSMPHSPRTHNGMLFYLDSGRGNLMWGKTLSNVFCPGFLRGLAFHRHYALTTVSLPRDGTFSGLELDQEITKRGTEAWCALLIINLETGAIEEYVRINGSTRELFDVCVLPNTKCPRSVSPFDNADLRNFVSFEPWKAADKPRLVAGE